MSTEPVVFIVDGDAERRESIRRLVESMAVDGRTYSSGFKFLDESATVSRGCLVCALRIADISGLQIQQRLLDSGSPLPVIFVSGQASTPIVVRAMQNGAITFLLSPWDDQELWENIQHAIRVSEIRQRCQRESLQWQERFKLLGDNERALLDLLLQGKRNGDIAKQQRVSLRTIESRRRRIMDTLGVDSFLELGFAVARQEPRACHLHDTPCFLYSNSATRGVASAPMYDASSKHGNGTLSGR